MVQPPSENDVKTDGQHTTKYRHKNIPSITQDYYHNSKIKNKTLTMCRLLFHLLLEDENCV